MVRNIVKETEELVKGLLKEKGILENSFKSRIEKYKKIDFTTPDENVLYFDEENTIDKEEIEWIYSSLSSVFNEISNHLASYYFTTPEALYDNWFLQNVSYQTYQQKYQLKEKLEDGTLVPVDRTVFHTFIRVALAVALTELRMHNKYSEEELYQRFIYRFAEYLTMLSFGLASGAGRVMANAGSKKYKTYTTLINCTVMSQIPDSIEGIMYVLKDAALTLKSGAGTGYDFSSIRPKGAFVKGAGAETSGVVSFAEIFDKMCSTIMSAGGRRGAQMAVIDIRHPESVDFFKAKRQDGTLRYFNISLLVPDSFIEKLKNDQEVEQWFWEFEGFISEKELKDRTDVVLVENGKLPYDYEDYELFAFGKNHQVMRFESFECTDCYRLYRKKVYRKVKASELYNDVMKSTYDFAEPGVIFIDRVNQKNILYTKEHIRATNPCGEQPLPPYGSCNLGSILLHRFVKEPFSDIPWEENFDFKLLEEVAYTMNVFLDGVNDITNLPLLELRKEAYIKRRHGLGITGLADALIMLGLKYGSKESLEFIEKAMKTIAFASAKASIDLAQEKFPAPINVTLKDWVEPREFNGKHVDTSYSFIKDEFPEFYEKYKTYQLRFSHATSIAPTGTMSLTFGNNVANGIEPTFSISYVRNIRLPGKKTKTQEEVFSFAAILWNNKFKNKNYPDTFVTTNDITVEEHINVQASAQKYVDSAISKTCNIPTDYPFEDFKKAYIVAYEKGLKGFTTFRFNPDVFVGVLVKHEDLQSMTIEFELEDGTKVQVKGNEKVFYDGEEHVAANLYEAIKEGIYGKM